MQAQTIDGKKIAKDIRAELTKEVKSLCKKGKTPGLAVVLVGKNPASRVYINMKKKACEQVGIYSEEHTLSNDAKEAELLDLIDQLNIDPKIHGILVQLPLPRQLDETRVLCRIAPEKDIDGFHPINIGRLSSGMDGYVPCTPAGIIELLHRMDCGISGKKAVVLGRSNIVGKPVAQLLLRENATVTVCHSKTADIKSECKQADILVVAIGRPEIVKGDWIKPGAVVIDVGINHVDDKLVGDVDFEQAQEVAGWITPVPGGVGPMTIAMLLQNTIMAVKKYH